MSHHYFADNIQLAPLVFDKQDREADGRAAASPVEKARIVQLTEED